MQKKLVVVADDFTGANDTGVQFKKPWSKVNVIINPSGLVAALAECDVVVIDLESRLVSPEEAYQRNFAAGQQLSGLGNCIVYKKLDSTFRGNIGAEIDALMDATNVGITILAPALPVYGRTIKDGEVFVNNIKLAETEVSRDPRSPVKYSRVADIIGLQSKRVCCSIGFDFFDLEEKEQKDFLLKEINKGSEIFIFDGANNSDLENVARFIDGINYTTFLLAGSAGLAGHLSRFALATQPLAFVFAGSTSEKTRVQINHAQERGSTFLINIGGEKLLGRTYQAEEVMQTVATQIENGRRNFIFTSALSDENIEQVFYLAKQLLLSNDEAARIVSVELGKLAAVLIKKFNPSGLLLTGGETAINTVLALGATGIEIDRELLPGIQSGRLTGCSVKSVVVTKAGGFGEPDAISKILEFFKG